MSALVKFIAIIIYCQIRFKMARFTARNQVLPSSFCIYFSFLDNVFFIWTQANLTDQKLAAHIRDHFKPGSLLELIVLDIVRKEAKKRIEPFIFLFFVYKKNLAIAIIIVLLQIVHILHNAKFYDRSIQHNFDTTFAKNVFILEINFYSNYACAFLNISIIAIFLI